MKLFKNNHKHHKRVEKISFKLNISEEIIEETLDIVYGYIRKKLDEVDIDKNRIITEEEFNEKFPIICIPSLGYIKPSYSKYKYIMKNKLKKDEKRRELKQRSQKREDEINS